MKYQFTSPRLGLRPQNFTTTTWIMTRRPRFPSLNNLPYQTNPPLPPTIRQNTEKWPVTIIAVGGRERLFKNSLVNSLLFYVLFVF